MFPLVSDADQSICMGGCWLSAWYDSLLSYHFSEKPMSSVVDNRSSTVGFTIRRCKLEDEAAARAVCLYTGDAGNDASEQYHDPNVLGYRYASPYIHFSPDLAFVLEDSQGEICGYVLATLQSDVFYQWYVNEWLPKMRLLYPTIPTSDSMASDEPIAFDGTKKDRFIIEGFHKDQLDFFSLFEDYPSHLHIDLLPKAQGSHSHLVLLLLDPAV